MKVFIIAAVLFASALAAPGVIDNKIESDSSMSKVMQYFGSCYDNEDMVSCLAIKGITALNRAARASSIKVTEGITLARYLKAQYDVWVLIVSKLTAKVAKFLR